MKETKQKSDENSTSNHPTGQKRRAEDNKEEDCKEAKIEGDEQVANCKKAKMEGDEQVANCKKAKMESSSEERIEVIDLCDSEEECQVLNEGSDETLFRWALIFKIYNKQKCKSISGGTLHKIFSLCVKPKSRLLYVLCILTQSSIYFKERTCSEQSLLYYESQSF